MYRKVNYSNFKDKEFLLAFIMPDYHLYRDKMLEQFRQDGHVRIKEATSDEIVLEENIFKEDFAKTATYVSLKEAQKLTRDKKHKGISWQSWWNWAVGDRKIPYIVWKGRTGDKKYVLLDEVLKYKGRSITKTAQDLHVSRETLYRWDKNPDINFEFDRYPSGESFVSDKSFENKLKKVYNKRKKHILTIQKCASKKSKRLEDIKKSIKALKESIRGFGLGKKFYSTKLLFDPAVRRDKEYLEEKIEQHVEILNLIKVINEIIKSRYAYDKEIWEDMNSFINISIDQTRLSKDDTIKCFHMIVRYTGEDLEYWQRNLNAYENLSLRARSINKIKYFSRSLERIVNESLERLKIEKEVFFEF